MGDPENSGFRRIQLRKYCNPTRLASRNLALNLKIALFGGRRGRAFFAPGKAAASLARSSSNSEYLYNSSNEAMSNREDAGKLEDRTSSEAPWDLPTGNAVNLS